MCIYDSHDIVSLYREHFIPDSYNKININYIIMDYLRQKISFVELQLLHIIYGCHDAYGSVKGQTGYTYYSPQCQNQEKSNYRIMFLFWEVDSSIVQMVCMIEGKSSNKRLWGRNSQLHDNGVLTNWFLHHNSESFSRPKQVGK